MPNPFDSSQYKTSITSFEIFDVTTATLSGAQAIMSTLRDAILLRQAAIASGYANDQPFRPVDVSSLSFDTPGGIRSASLIFLDAVLQFVSGHSSGEYERLATRSCNPEAVDPFGFFQKFSFSSGTYNPEEGYFFSLADLFDDGLTQNDINILLQPPTLGNDATPTIPIYVAAQGAWANSLIKILNKFIFIHKSLIFRIPDIECFGSQNNCAFNYSLAGFDVEPTWNDNPVEIIVDVSESLVCAGPNESGYLCLSFSSLVGRHRVVVLPTIDRNSPDNTITLRSRLYGFESIGSEGIPYGGGTGTSGYLDSQFYSNNAAQAVRFDGAAEGIPCPVSPLADSSCVNTISQFPPFPWKKQGDVGKVCIPINTNHFSTSQEADDGWRYKLRVIVFPNCSPFFASSMQWNLGINCMDCTCDDIFCGGDDPPPPPGPPRSICTFNQTRSGPGPLTVHDYVVLAPTNSSDKVCLRFRTNIGSFAPDRMYILRTWYPSDHAVDPGYASVQDMISAVRSPVFGARDVDLTGQGLNQTTSTGYYNPLFYQSEADSNNFSHDSSANKHPYFSRPGAGQPGSARINCPSSAILLDSGCVHSRIPDDFTPYDVDFPIVDWCYEIESGSFIACISIPPEAYSNDINDPWYRRVRIIVFDDCDNIGVAAWTASGDCIGSNCSQCPCDDYVVPSSSSSSSSKVTPSSSSSSEFTPPSSSSSSEAEPPPPSSSSSGGTGPVPCTFPPCSSITSCEDIPDDSFVQINDLCTQCYNYLCPNPILIGERDLCLIQEFLCFDFVQGRCCPAPFGPAQDGVYVQQSGNPDCICESVDIKDLCDLNCDQNCLGIGSKVTMADGSLKEIERLKEGDVILSVDFGYYLSKTDLLSSNYNIPPRDTWRYVETTVKSIKFGFEKDYFVINEKLRATFEHPVLVKDQEKILFRSTSIIKPTDKAYNEKLEEMPCVIKKIDMALATVKINTEPYDWFFAEGILVHNAETNGETGIPSNDGGGGGPNPFSSSSSGPDPFGSSSSSVKIIVG